MSPSSAERPTLARLALVLWTVALTGVGLALISAVCWRLVPPIQHDAAFIARYAVLDGFFYSRQPAKTLAFQCCLAAAPILIFTAITLGRKFIFGLETTALQRFVRGALIVHLVLFAACIRPLFYYPHPPLWLSPTWLLCPVPFPPPVPGWEWMGGVLLALALGFIVVAGFPPAWVRRFVTWTVIVFALGCAPVEFYAPSQVTNDTAFTYHLNALLDALSQSINGHHLLVDFPHIYGGYGEMLAPLLRLFPRTMAVPLIALALPTLLAVGFWLRAAFRLVPHPAVLALVAMALLGVNYLSALPPSYCYGTPRTLFPSLVLILAISYFRRPGQGRYAIVSALAAVASIWNLDTGLVLWFAWTLTLVAGEANQRAFGRAAAHFFIQGALLVGAWGAFFLYLRLVSHQAPDPGLLLYFQSMVVQSGYFCVALIVPSAWTFVALLYITGLVVAALAHLRHRVPWRGRVVLMLSLLGIGMFSYYLGRSAESNLISTSAPGILLVGLLADGALARIRKGLLPPTTRWFILPWAVMIFWWGLLFFVQLPLILGREKELARAAFGHNFNLVQTNAAFAAGYVKPGESDVYFLSGHSGFYYYLTGTVRPLRIPGNVELLKMQDMERIDVALLSRRLPKLFVERNFWTMDMYRPYLYRRLNDLIQHNYRPVASSPSGSLTLFVPIGPPFSTTAGMP